MNMILIIVFYVVVKVYFFFVRRKNQRITEANVIGHGSVSCVKNYYTHVTCDTTSTQKKIVIVDGWDHHVQTQGHFTVSRV